jgi:two-component system nitrate/nitrite response regulator NarL
MPDDALTFLIVDDHALYRTGLAMTLAQAWPLARVLQAASLAEGLHMAVSVSGRPSLVLLDVHLPDGNGLEALNAWSDSLPSVPVVMISSELSADALQRAREAGVAGYVHKAAPPADIIASLRSALRGEPALGTMPYDILLPPEVKPDVLALREPPANDPPSPLQQRILRHLGQGAPNKAIARQLGLGEMQVRAEVSWLTEALDASSREEAYRKAVERGWVGP